MKNKAEEKSKELVEKLRTEIYRGLIFTDDFNPARDRAHTEKAKQCALIAVHEIMNILFIADAPVGQTGRWKYWSDVKSEIQKL